MIDDMFTTGRDQFIVKPFAQLPAVVPCFADPPRCTTEPSSDGAFGQALQIDGRVKPFRPQPPPQSQHLSRRFQPVARDPDEFIQCAVAFEQITGATFDNPSQVCLRSRVAERTQHRHTVDYIADGGKPDNEDA